MSSSSLIVAIPGSRPGRDSNAAGAVQVLSSSSSVEEVVRPRHRVAESASKRDLAGAQSRRVQRRKARQAVGDVAAPTSELFNFSSSVKRHLFCLRCLRSGMEEFYAGASWLSVPCHAVSGSVLCAKCRYEHSLCDEVSGRAATDPDSES